MNGYNDDIIQYGVRQSIKHSAAIRRAERKEQDAAELEDRLNTVLSEAVDMAVNVHEEAARSGVRPFEIYAAMLVRCLASIDMKLEERP